MKKIIIDARPEFMIYTKQDKGLWWLMVIDGQRG